MAKFPLVQHVHVGTDNRISIPKHFSERFEWIKGTEIEAWLFLIEPGRHRLLSDEDVQNDAQLDPIRLLIIHEHMRTGTAASYSERSNHAAVAATLFPTTMKLHTGGWRIPLADEWKALAPLDVNPRAISFLLAPEGYLELWFTDVLRRTLTPSWHNPR
jgi:hypothetical protein